MSMANKDAVKYIESSFLKPLLENEDITDISYNGHYLFYVGNKEGRKKSEINVLPEDVTSFLRQIANLTEKSLNLALPILDVSFGRYRLNGINYSLGRYEQKKTPSFSLRLASKTCRVDENDFLDNESRKLLLNILNEERSIVIGGKTSSGKTELQKWFLLNAKEGMRMIVIDNVEELDLINNDKIDLTTWISDEANHYSSLSFLIKNALRHNPDYLLIAEARGGEMLDALASAGSGHPLITTLHADSLKNMPHRVLRLALMGKTALSPRELKKEIYEAIPYYVYVEKIRTNEGFIKRFVSGIGKLENDRMHILYERSML